MVLRPVKISSADLPLLCALKLAQKLKLTTGTHTQARRNTSSSSKRAAMHFLDGFLDASPSLWMLWTLCHVAALLTGCWFFTWSLERRIQALLLGSRIELGAQLQDLERKITAILDELGRAQALSQAAPGTCGPARVDNELSRCSRPRQFVPASVRRTMSYAEAQAHGELCQPHQARRVKSDDNSTRISSIGRASSDGNPTRASKQRDQHEASTGDSLIEHRQSATGKYEVAAMGNGGARRASVRCGEGLAAAEGAGRMLSIGGARGASVSGGVLRVLPARQTDTETLAISTLGTRVKHLASTPEHSVQVTKSRSRGSLKRTASLPDASAQVASVSSRRLSSEGTSRPLACHQRHLWTDLASTITDREPDVFKRTPPSGRSTEDSASSSIEHTGSSGQRWRPLVLHEQSWKNMSPEIITRTSSLPSSGRAPDDRHPLARKTHGSPAFVSTIAAPAPDVSSGGQALDDSLSVFGKGISLTPPRDHMKLRTGCMPLGVTMCDS